MTLVPQVVDAVGIPVIAAGGVGDGRGIVAAWALGAEGVQVGTRFVCSTECNAHVRYKEEIMKAGDRSSAITGKRTGHPVRCLKNKLSQEFDKLEERLADIKEFEELGAGRLRKAVVEGDVEWGSVMAGQIAGMITDVKPAAQIIREMFAEAEATVLRLASI
jgi:enoyl-[acyl-carrier protein] reductase II